MIIMKKLILMEKPWLSHYKWSKFELFKNLKVILIVLEEDTYLLQKTFMVI